MHLPIRAAAPVAAVLLASFTPPLVGALSAQTGAAFDRSVVLGGEWLQANALPLNRNALGSLSFDAALRRSRWAIDAGWLRIARDLSTVQGGFVSLGVPLAFGRLLAVPSVGAFGGQVKRSVDSTGYDWVDANGNPGHTPRYSYSQAGSAGGGVGLSLELPVYSIVALRASASEWYFSGAPLQGDRTRTLVGLGLALRLHALGGGRR